MTKASAGPDIPTLISDIYESMPAAWVAKEGNMGFKTYVTYVERIQRVRAAHWGAHDSEPLRFLDVGMSMGVVACAMATLGMSVSGCDYLENQNHPFLADVRRRYGVEYKDYDATTDDLPYDDNAFDIVNCNDMIEHLHTSPRRMLLEVLRVLKRDGVFILLRHAADRCRACGRCVEACPSDAIHVAGDRAVRLRARLNTVAST